MSDCRTDGNKYDEERYKKRISDLEHELKDLRLQCDRLIDRECNISMIAEDLYYERERLAESKKAAADWEKRLNAREKRLQEMEEHNMDLLEEHETVKKKEEILDYLLGAASVANMLDSAVLEILKMAVIDTRVIGAYNGTMQISAIEYLKCLQADSRRLLCLNPYPKYLEFPPDNPYDQNSNEWEG